MGKKDKWLLDSTDGQYDKLFEAVTREANEKYPGKVFSGGAECMRVVCIPVPAFSVRYLFQQDGFPLGRFTMLVGERESCKSALGYEIMSWHGKIPGGGGVMVPTENKDAPELFRSIVGYNHPRMRIQESCSTSAEWMAVTNMWIKQFQSYMGGTKKDPGPGRKAPIAFLVDSLTANLTAGQYEDLHKAGTPAKHFAELAFELTDYIKYVTQSIKGYPFSLIGINHLKVSQEKVGMFMKNIRKVGGGETLKFFETTEIEMRRMGGTAPEKQIDRIKDNEQGIPLDIIIHKNSLAPHERISVEMLWWTDYADRDPAGHFRQKTIFDWHSASIEILAELLKGEGVKAKRLREVIDLTVSTDSRTASSVLLGIGPKSKVKYREAGQILEEKLQSDEEFRNALYAETGIRRRYLFQPDVDYPEQIARAVRLAAGEPVEANENKLVEEVLGEVAQVE
jgi:hypothetical protein